MASSSGTAAGAVKIPPNWLHPPNFATRSELYDARRADTRQLALDNTRPSPYFDRNFAITEMIFRDSYRKSGVADVLNKSASAASIDAREFHARAVASGSPTRSALLATRLRDTRLESLKFEPPEILRLMDIPKPGAEVLRDWWTKVDGYVEDPAPMLQHSLRLQLQQRSPQRASLGPMDPAKMRSPASVDERRRVKQTKAQLADKITKIVHASPHDYQGRDRSDSSVVIRAADLYAQEKHSGGGGRSDGGGECASRSESPLTFPVSPIKPTHARSPKRSHRHVENLFLESTNQRVLLDQIKSCPSPHSGAVTSLSTTPSRGGGGGLGGRSGSSFTLTDGDVGNGVGALQSPSELRRSIRCGGFS